MTIQKPVIEFFSKRNENEQLIQGENKKHSENADTSTSMTLTLIRGQESLCHRLRLLYCILVPGMIYDGVILFFSLIDLHL